MQFLEKFQNSENLIESEIEYEIKKGKFIIHENATNRNCHDEKSFRPVSLHENDGQIGENVFQKTVITPPRNNTN